MSGPLRLLLAEDDDNDVALLVRELTRAGYDLTLRIVATPTDLETAMKDTWDIAISDWGMPAMTGLDAFHIVRKHDLDLPFIIVSGTISEDIAVDALKAGVHDFMSKGKWARLIPAIERTRHDATIRRRQRKVDAELERQRLAIERSERLLRAVLDSVPDGVLVADQAGNVVTANPAAIAMLQLPTNQRVHILDPLLIETFHADGVTPLAPDERVIAQALAGHPVDRVEHVLRARGDASAPPVFVSVSARPLREKAEIVGALAVLRDVSSERRAQDQLIVADRMASVGTLAAGVAHEINNPLAAVLANLDLMASTLLEHAQLEATELRELREMLDDARSAADRVRQIVRDLKMFSRRDDLASGAVDIRRALESTLRMAWNEIRQRARVVKDYGELPFVRGDESRLAQVFLNLIVHAASSMPEGDIERNSLRITATVVRAGGRDDKVVVTIAATGAGMSREAIANLFTPFFPVKTGHADSGLGLAISQRIVTALGGKLEVESELGRGTTFRVELPTASETSNSAITRPPATVPAQPQVRAKILVVDDEPMIASAIRRVLSRDHEIHTVTRALAALERVQAGESFDVILCDLLMPEMTGMELHDALVDYGQADRIIFLTGGAFTAAGRSFLDRVPNQRIEKPFDSRHLRALISDRVK